MSDALATRRSSAPGTRRTGGGRSRAPAAAGWLGVAGLVATVVVWWAAIHALTEPGSLGRQFAPDSA
ncbi:ABC transporter permease, partial [Burkholderia cenocepacia]